MEEILEDCKLELLFKASAEPSIIKPEDGRFFWFKIVVKRSNSGIKFAVLVVPKLGEAVIWRVLATKIVGGRLSESDLNSYGELIAR